MPRPPKLTNEQKTQLRTLEPALRSAVRLRDYQQAKAVTKKIQDLLRPTGHETRLMQAKNWLFEAAFESGDVETAIAGFVGVRKKTNSGTRVHLEATAMLAICHLRLGKVGEAKPLIEHVLSDTKCIKSEARRRQFRQRIVLRFNEETALAALKDTGHEPLDIDQIEREAGALVSKKTEDELLDELGSAIPREVIARIVDVDRFSRSALPHHELKYLPSPESIEREREVGRTVFSACKTVLHRSLCDPNSDFHLLWSQEGMGAVLNRKYIGAAVAGMCVDLGIGLFALAVPITALIFRFGIDVYCERYKPMSVMIGRDESD